MTGTERKTFQKYYPPDFDPKKLKKERGKKRSLQFVQRVMAPFNMQCNTCHEYIYKGKKFNMRRETAEGEAYLGLKIFRFYFRCPNCLAEISFKTDIENVDYTAEHGATRLFEAFKYYQEQEKKRELEEEAEKNDAMKMLEKRTKMSRAEMEAVGKLEQLQELSRKQQQTNPLDYLVDVDKQKQFSQAELLKLQEEEDEREIARLMNLRNSTKIEEDSDDEDLDEEDDAESSHQSKPSSSAAGPSTSSKSLYSSIKKQSVPKPKSLLSGIVLKKPPPSNSTPASNMPPAKPSSSLMGLADYGSDSAEEDN